MISNINTAFGKDWTFINLFKLDYCSWHINSVISFNKIKLISALSWAELISGKIGGFLTPKKRRGKKKHIYFRLGIKIDGFEKQKRTSYNA